MEGGELSVRAWTLDPLPKKKKKNKKEGRKRERKEGR
jgi:hypothetical protein